MHQNIALTTLGTSLPHTTSHMSVWCNPNLSSLIVFEPNEFSRMGPWFKNYNDLFCSQGMIIYLARHVRDFTWPTAILYSATTRSLEQVYLLHSLPLYGYRARPILTGLSWAAWVLCIVLFMSVRACTLSQVLFSKSHSCKITDCTRVPLVQSVILHEWTLFKQYFIHNTI